MMFCGDNRQVDLNYFTDSAVNVVDKLQESKYVYGITLKDNHRHPSLDEVLRILEEC